MNSKPLQLHWFFLVSPFVVASDVYVGLTSRGEVDRLVEAGLLFDLVVLIPCLYWLCYRQRGRGAVVRAAAIACLGIWAALKLVPEAERDLLNYVVPLRYAGILALVWLELIVVVEIYRTIFKGGSVSEAMAQAPANVPPWVTKLLALEAQFWLKTWSAIRRAFKK
jgi:hypothetical protein